VTPVVQLITVSSILITACRTLFADVLLLGTLCFVCVPDDRRAGVVFALAAHAKMFLFVFRVIAPLRQTCLRL
jgi:hypothetical protein